MIQKTQPLEGTPTSQIIQSVHIGNNENVFPLILKLHVPEGSVIADVTFGKGVFWKKVPVGQYELLASDITAKPDNRSTLPYVTIQDGIDCRKLPYDNESLDCVVLDPPYMEGFYRKSVQHLAGGGTHAAFRRHYSNGQPTKSGPKWHDAVTAMYVDAGKETFQQFVPNCFRILFVS